MGPVVKVCLNLKNKTVLHNTSNLLKSLTEDYKDWQYSSLQKSNLGCVK